MRKSYAKIAVIIALVIVIAIAAFCGCTRATTTVDTTNRCEVVKETNEATVKVEGVDILVDESLSTEGIRKDLSEEAERLYNKEISEGKSVARWSFSDGNGRDTDIVAALEKTTPFCKVYILTDGWDDPMTGNPWDFSRLNLPHRDIIFVCPEKTEYTEKLIEAIQTAESFSGSSVTIRYLDETDEEEILFGYTPLSGSSAYTDKYCKHHNGDNGDIADTAAKTHWPWWAWLLLLLLLPLLGLLLWWLFSRRKEDEDGEEHSDEPPTNPVDQGARHGEEEEVDTTKPVGEVASPVPTAPITTPVSAPTDCCRCCCPRQHGNSAAILAAIAAFIAALALAAGAAWLWLGL